MEVNETGASGRDRVPLLSLMLVPREQIYIDAPFIASLTSKKPFYEGKIRIVEAAEWYSNPPESKQESSDGNSN